MTQDVFVGVDVSKARLDVFISHPAQTFAVAGIAALRPVPPQ